MWQRRISEILSAPFEMLSLEPSSYERFRGRYLRLDNDLLGLGSLVAQGAEAMVYEAIDIRCGARAGVAKICRFAPGSDEYRAWAVPYRHELNPASAKPDIEMYPATLLQVQGGLIKLQDWISDDARVDWSMTEPAKPIWFAYGKDGADAALRCAEDLIQKHGPKGILLETQGRILCKLERWEEARDVLEAAFKAHAVESRAGILRTGLLLAEAHRRIYQSRRWEGAAARITLAVPDGPTLSQIIYSDPQASALDDSLDDRAMYILLEILGHEPCFLPALFMLAEELAGSQITWEVALEILGAIERIDPEQEETRNFRNRLLESQKRYFEHLDSIAVPNSEAPTEAKGDDQLSLASNAPSEAVPDFARTSIQAFEDTYDPEPSVAQIAQARYRSVWANLAGGRVRQAEEAARAATALDPLNVLYPIALSHVLQAADRVAEAGDLLEDVTRQFPDRPEGFISLGEFHLEQGDPANARIDFLRASRLEVEYQWRIDIGLGQAYRKLGDRIKALHHLRNAYANAPNHKESESGPRRLTWKAWSGMLLSYALRDEQQGATDAEKQEAMQTINSVVMKYPEEPALLVCRGQSLAMFGKLKEAIEDLERAGALDPDHPAALELAALLRQHLEQQSQDEP